MIPSHTPIRRATSDQYNLSLTSLGGESTCESFVGRAGGGEGCFGEVGEGCGEHGGWYCLLYHKAQRRNNERVSAVCMLQIDRRLSVECGRNKLSRRFLDFTKLKCQSCPAFLGSDSFVGNQDGCLFGPRNFTKLDAIQPKTSCPKKLVWLL